MENINRIEEQIINDFKNLDCLDWKACDKYFEKHGVGYYFDIKDRTLERLLHYEQLLKALQNADPEKYNKCHKGTPYYFLGWFCFDMGYYSRAYFYFDLGVYEDRWHKHPDNPNGWMDDPGSEIMLLKDIVRGSAGKSVCQKQYGKIKQIIDVFNIESKKNISISDLSNKFLVTNIGKSLELSVVENYRPMICSMFSFFMENEIILSDIKLRSSQSGSISPLLGHLFLGCIVFESIMKMNYSKYGGRTLGDYISKAIELKDLDITNKIYPKGCIEFQYIIDNLDNIIKNNSYAESCIGITYMIRNTVGHSLNWPDRFDENVYTKLFNCICNAVLWVIYKKYIQ